MKLTQKAHAKLNLFLEVTGKRANGYHELFSLAVFLDLADEITVEPAETISVSQSNGDFGITDNIIHKTATMLAKKYKVTGGAKITFSKNIPIGGGLGGGSSDAAVTLLLLNTLWNLNLSDDEIYEIGLKLGADVPVCLYSILENTNAAIFHGIGEIIKPAPKIPAMFFTLVNPAVQLATRDVFSAFKYEGLGYEPLTYKGDFFKNIIIRSNDLEPAAIHLVPHIDVALSELDEAHNCILARMTGSGATSFGIFKKHIDAHNAAITLIKKYPDWQIGAVGLKSIIKPPRGMGKIFRKGLRTKFLGLSLAIHLLLFILLAGFFIYKKYTPAPQPEFVTVSFKQEEPAYQPVLENELKPAAGDIVETLPAPEPVTEKPPPKPKPAKKPPAKIITKLGKPPGILGAKNTANPGKAITSDYLDLLQYTVRQRSAVPNNNPGLKGRAILHLAFNRKGYVLAYTFKQRTGSPILDKAAEKVAKSLMNNPFPPAPWNFDIGEEVLEYDFVISYPRGA